MVKCSCEQMCIEVGDTDFKSDHSLSIYSNNDKSDDEVFGPNLFSYSPFFGTTSRVVETGPRWVLHASDLTSSILHLLISM